jgi:hypothetical protein
VTFAGLILDKRHIFDEKSVSEAKERVSPEEIFASMH